MNRKIQKECESGCEYILPDYMGDIKKLLMARAKVIPVGKFVGEGSLEISGIVEYEALYTDSEGKLTAINTSSDFSEAFPVETERYVDSAAESRIADLKVRITGPRKIAMKSEVELALTLSEENSFRVEGDAFEGEKTVEKCTRVINFASSSFQKSGEREYAEVAERLGEADADSVETVAVSATSHVMGAKCLEGEVVIKGENIVSAILRTEDRHPFKIKKVIPFEETVAFEGARPDMAVIAEGIISSATIGIGSENEESVAVANVICEYGIELIDNISETVVTDAYLTDRETANTYRDTEYAESVFCSVKEFCIDISGKKESLLLTGAKEILAANAEIRRSEAKLFKNGSEFTLDLAVSGVALEANADGSVSYIPIKLQEEKNESVSFDCQVPDGAMLEYSLSVMDVEPMLDAEDLTFKCTVSAKLYLLMPKEIKRLYSCDLCEGEAVSDGERRITVYFPKEGERLFDVAKKYRTTVAKIARDNSIAQTALEGEESEQALSGIRKLIIR